METIILKIIACSGIVLGFYHLFLAKESTFKFNRYFLLIGLVFSYCIPFFTIKLPPNESEKTAVVWQQEMQQQAISSSIITESYFNIEIVLMIVYSSITIILILKILYSLFKIKNLKGRSIKYQNTNVKVLEKKGSPFSFWNTIYLSESDFKNNKIDKLIFLHEKIHLQERHSIDLIFVEVLTAFTWFNPFIYLFKKAINNNHEFVVDQEVIAATKNVRNYQELIFNEISKHQNYNLTHQLHFNNTKKRFIMMTTKNSKYALAKKYVSIPAFAILAFAFAEKVYANPTLSENSIQKQNSKETQLFAHEENDDQAEKSTISSDTISPSKSVQQNIDKGHKESSINGDTVYDGDSKNITNPAYPGGINQFRNEVSSNFDGSIFVGNEGLVKTTITFTIETDGTTSNIKTAGENEKFNTESLKTVTKVLLDKKWTPATKDGEPIAYRFKLPLTMSFESFKK